jgi:hypothetical protein
MGTVFIKKLSPGVSTEAAAQKAKENITKHEPTLAEKFNKVQFRELGSSNTR